MPRFTLHLYKCTGIADLDPLRNMPLTDLDIDYCPVKDLSPLRGMPLKRLHMYKSPAPDLTPLTDLPLQELVFNPRIVVKKEMDILRNMKSLTTIIVHTRGAFSPADFWKSYDNGEFKK